MDPSSPVQIPVHRGQVVDRLVRLTPRKGSGIVLSEPKSASPLLKAVLVPPKASDPEGSYLLKLKLGPCKATADVSAVVMIKTTSQQLPIANVVAVGLQLEGALASPSQVLFSSTPSGAAGEQLTNLQVYTRSSTDFKVTRVRSSLPELEAKVQTDTPGRLYSLRVVRKQPLKSGRHTGELEILTSDPKTPRIAVPIDITVS
jgi:hypothetical protein